MVLEKIRLEVLILAHQRHMSKKLLKVSCLKRQFEAKVDSSAPGQQKARDRSRLDLIKSFLFEHNQKRAENLTNLISSTNSLSFEMKRERKLFGDFSVSAKRKIINQNGNEKTFCL